MTIRLGVLDQSPIISGRTAQEAVRETVKLAQLAEQWGYSRYWLAEHHAISALADPCPEILAARIGAATSRIRIGTGGVLMPYYSPLKVAEVFRMLEALYPGRIDLGLGRAPGGDMRTARALSGGGYPLAEQFPEQVRELAGLLGKSLAPDHPHAGIKVQPDGNTTPQLWLLGSSEYSGALAAQLGLRFSFAHFISAHGGESVARAYREDYVASLCEPEPVSQVCVFVICASSADKAEQLAKSVDLRRLHMALGIDSAVPTLAEAEAHSYTREERIYIQQQRERLVHGDPDQVRDKLLALKEQFAADELMILCITGDYATRRESYRLVAQAFELDR